MAFVNCTKFKESQGEQDERLDNLEQCCTANKEAISNLGSGLVNEESLISLVDASGTVTLGKIVG